MANTPSAREPLNRELLNIAATAAVEALGEALVALDVSEQFYFADYFLIVSADNHRHSRSIIQVITREVKTTLGRLPEAVEGEGESNWVVIDYGDVVIHVLLPEERQYYALEKLWNRSPRVELEPVAEAGLAAGAAHSVRS